MKKDVTKDLWEAVRAYIKAEGRVLSKDPEQNITIPLADGSVLSIPVVFEDLHK